VIEAGGMHGSVLAQKARVPALPAVAAAVLFHAAVFSGALVLPRLFDRPPPLRKPIIAHMIALGKPRDLHLLPRKQPAPAAAAAPAPGKKPSTTAKPAPAQKPPPTRQELMERALARAAGRAVAEEKPEPDPERAGQKTGSAEGTAESSEEGEAYFTAVHDAIQENYVVPSVISERERLYLSASVVVSIGPAGQLLKQEFQTRSGNTFFDQALQLAIQRTKLPAPPADLARVVRDGVVLNFKP
jgi:outer membrane biosynthesis protein TonB